MLDAVHSYLTDFLPQSWGEGAFTTLIVQKWRPRLKEVKRPAYDYVDLGHGDSWIFRIQANVPDELVLLLSILC